MSFFEYKDFIEAGDQVLAFIGRGNLKSITVTPGKSLGTRYGNFAHERMVGMRYGEQMSGAKGVGFIHLLHPSAELWTLSLPHRTQIVYTPDSSYIMQRLGVSSGTRVIEAGTGSGSFSHAFARTIGSSGRLFSYEFHEPRYDEARDEFARHGLLARNTVITHRDVCLEGFEIAAEVSANVVFLDLPAPWTAVPHLDKVIDRASQVGICCFSPCIEQVEKTVRALQQCGWSSIEMVEVAAKRWEARKEMVKDISDVVKRLKDIQSRKTKGIENRRHARVAEQDAASQPSEPEDAAAVAATADGPPHKFQNLGKGFNPFGKGQRVKEGDAQWAWSNVTRVEAEIKSHTSYLTFAYMNPNKRVA
ncbi:tRNA (adenine(58)-N(1))-methyltransferase catalytic subunit TRM61 [[Candida] zeylanoides]